MPGSGRPLPLHSGSRGIEFSRLFCERIQLFNSSTSPWLVFSMAGTYHHLYTFGHARQRGLWVLKRFDRCASVSRERMGDLEDLMKGSSS